MKWAARYTLAVLAMAPLFANNAHADPNTDDVHCYIIYNQMTMSGDKTMMTAGLMGQIYWIGRLDGRTPNFDLENAIEARRPDDAAGKIARTLAHANKQSDR